MTTTALENELYNALNTNIDFNPLFKSKIELTKSDEADNALCFARAIIELAGKGWRTNNVDDDECEQTLAKEHLSVTFNFQNYTYRIGDAKAIVKGVDLN